MSSDGTIEIHVSPARAEVVAKLKAAVAEAIDAHASSILVDPDISTVTLLVRLDRGPEPDVLFRTEARRR